MAELRSGILRPVTWCASLLRRAKLCGVWLLKMRSALRWLFVTAELLWRSVCLLPSEFVAKLTELPGLVFLPPSGRREAALAVTGWITPAQECSGYRFQSSADGRCPRNQPKSRCCGCRHERCRPLDRASSRRQQHFFPRLAFEAADPARSSRSSLTTRRQQIKPYSSKSEGDCTGRCWVTTHNDMHGIERHGSLTFFPKTIALVHLLQSYTQAISLWVLLVFGNTRSCPLIRSATACIAWLGVHN